MNDIITPENLKALPLDAAIKKFGTPTAQDTFVIDEHLPEFRIELYNYFKDYKGKDIKIREATWSLTEDKNITAWYRDAGDQAPVHTLVWAKNSEF